MNLFSIDSKELVNLAKAGKHASLTPGTFTISNLGMLNVDNFVAVINPPQVYTVLTDN